MNNRKKHYEAWKSWPLDELPLFLEHSTRYNAMRLRGAISCELTYEARSRVHSSATHKVLRVEGAGVAFKKAAELAGYRVYSK